MIKKVSPRWQRLGFASEEEMNTKLIAEARWLDGGYYQAKEEKENENGRD